MRGTATPPACVNWPAATSIVGSGPGPSGSHWIMAAGDEPLQAPPPKVEMAGVHWALARGARAKTAASNEKRADRISMPGTPVAGYGSGTGGLKGRVAGGR